MQNILDGVSVDLSVLIPIVLLVVALIVVYLVFMVRAVIDMLNYDVPGVLLTFAFLALIPIPFFLIMGLMVLIIWHYHKKHILQRPTQSG